MNHKNKLIIPTLIALMASGAVSQSLQAQAPARQAFSWSSASVTPAASVAPRASSPVATPIIGMTVELPANSGIRSLDNAPSIAESTTSFGDNALAAAKTKIGETIYLDEKGNEITREQMQAKLTNVENQVGSALPSVSHANQSFRSLEQRVAHSASVDNSIWDNTKNVTSKATSFWKKPSLFKTPEGITLPSMKTTWTKPKFDQPTTWFSRKTTSPITFPSIDSLPRKGKSPTSIDRPLISPTQVASQAAAVERLAESFDSVDEINSVGQSVFNSTTERVASQFDSGGDFNPQR